jgi:hypothetical protein
MGRLVTIKARVAVMRGALPFLVVQSPLAVEMSPATTNPAPEDYSL